MLVQVKFFANLREQFGRDGEELDSTTCETVADVWEQVSGLAEIPRNLRAAVNLEYVSMSHVVREGDEVAFFPPVTGG